MVNKKIVIICTIIALVIVGTIVGIKIKNFKEKEYVNENTENKKTILEYLIPIANTLSFSVKNRRNVLAPTMQITVRTIPCIVFKINP